MMALMIGELYEALRLAQVPDDKARAAATAVADFQRRIGRIEALVSVNTAVAPPPRPLALTCRECQSPV